MWSAREVREGVALAAGGAACVGAALLMRSWEVPYLALTLTATVVAFALGATRTPRLPWRTWSLLLVGMAGVVLDGWQSVRRSMLLPVGKSVVDLEARLREEAATIPDELRLSANRLVGVALPDPGAVRVRQVEALLPPLGKGEAAAVVMENGVPIAWAGPVRLSLDRFESAEGVVWGEFYVVAYARATRGTRTAIAMRTIEAFAPADHLSRSWVAELSGRVGLERIDVSRMPPGVPAMTVGSGGDRLWLRPHAIDPARLRFGVEERARLLIAVLLALAVTTGLWVVWVTRHAGRTRLVALAAVLVILAAAPLSTLSNTVPVFNAGYFFSPLGGPYTASVGALGITGLVGCLAVLVLLRRSWRHPQPLVGWGVVAACVVGGPFLLRELARGVTLPPRGVSTPLWMAWEISLFLVAVAVLLAGTWGTGALRSRRLPNVAWIAALGAGAAALVAPLLWQADSRFPLWYQGVWMLCLAGVVFSRPGRSRALHVALVAACGATIVLWSSVSRKRVDLAVRDVAQLTIPDAEVHPLLERLLADVRSGPLPRTRGDLLKAWVASDLAAANVPAELAVWTVATADQGPDAELVVARMEKGEGERILVRLADSARTEVLRDMSSNQGVQLVMGAPLDSGRALSVVLAPRTQLIGEDPFAALLGLEVPTIVEPPYRLTVSPGGPVPRSTKPSWVRRDDELHGDWDVDAPEGRLHAHVEVELRSLDVLFARGGLLILLDLAVLGALWVVVAVSDRPLRRWIRARARRWRSSYRARLTATLFAAFVLPSLAFGFWTLNRLRAEDLTSRSLLVRETLRAVRVRTTADLEEESRRLETPLFWYRQGVLQAAAEPLHMALAPLGHLLDPVAAGEVVFGLEAWATRRISVGRVPTLVGYRATGDGNVLAVPARRSELTLERQQRDVLALLLVSMALAAVIAWGLSGLAARAFARPIGALRRAAEEVAGGARELPSLGEAPPAEFRPVFERFRQMAVELSDSRQDLARAQRVFAWGEMARQVAHEIKNPLTPIRLGVQHLRRAHADQRPDFPQILDRNVERILGEIDRLDHIARSFSKFGMRPDDAPPTERVLLQPILADAIELERMGEGSVEWTLACDDQLVVKARADELREVVINVVENARLAHAARVHVSAALSGDQVVVTVDDDGDGVSEEHLAHVFEPRFSTRTSGSGLGLAISRRLVESWGGSIRLERRAPRGTRVIIALVAEGSP